MTQQGKIRLFIGIRILPDHDLLAVQKQMQLSLQDCKIKWVESINFHLTIKFLGDTESFYLNTTETMLEAIGRTHKPFKLSWDKPGFFGSKFHPAVIWYGFKESEDFKKLRMDIQAGLADLGIKSPDNNSKLHLTFGRIKDCSPEINLIDVLSKIQPIKGSFTIHSFELIQSLLTPTGPNYITIKEIPLSNSYML